MIKGITPRDLCLWNAIAAAGTIDPATKVRLNGSVIEPLSRRVRADKDHKALLTLRDMKMLVRFGVVASAVCLQAVFASDAMAADPDQWQFEATPYLLAAGLQGTVGVRGVESDMDVPFSDLVDSLEGGFMGLFTARRGPWMLGFEVVYMKLEDEGARSVTGPFGQVSVDGALELTTEMYIYQGSVGYRVLDRITKVDLIGAVRYTKLDVEADVQIDTTPGIVFPGRSKNTSGSESWSDVVVGAHVLHPVSDHVSLTAYADVGGGGSDLTYQVIAGVNWAFKHNLTAKLGYRYINWDYEDDDVVWDVAASGPYLGLGIRF